MGEMGFRLTFTAENCWLSV